MIWGVSSGGIRRVGWRIRHHHTPCLHGGRRAQIGAADDAGGSGI